MPRRSLTKFESNFDKSFWFSVLFLLPAYAHRLSAGGAASSFEDLKTVSLTAVGYACNILSILLIQFFTKNRPISPFIYVAFSAIALVGAVQTFFVYQSYVLLGSGIIAIYLRAMIWLFAVLLYARAAFEPRSFVNAFIWLSRTGLAITALAGLLHVVIGTNFGIIIAQGAARAHGIFSEPSTLGAIAPAFLIISLLRRNFLDAAIAILAIFFATSTIVFASVGIMALIFITYPARRLQIAIIAIYIGVFILSVAFVNQAVSYSISDIGLALSRILDETIGQSEFRTFVIDRLLTAMIDLPSYLQTSLGNFGDTGNLARFAGPQVMIALMQSDGFYFFGYGLSSFGVIALLVYRSVLDFGILPFLISSFGIYLGVIATLWATWRIVGWRKIDASVFFIFTGALIGTIGNSAGGLTMYALVFLGALAWRPV